MFDTFGRPQNFVEGGDDGPADKGMGGSYGDDDAWEEGQGKYFPEDWSDDPTVPGEDWTDQDWPEEHDHQGLPKGEEPEDVEEVFRQALMGQMPADEEPIEHRASEAEKLYANLLLKTDFERDFIEEMLEFDPDEESEMRIDELRRKRREMKELAQGMAPAPQGTTTILI